jgi:hypothetical protein
MSFVATAIIGGSVLAAAGSIYGASKAADAQKAAAQKASDTAMAQYNTTRGDLAPYRAIGTDAGNRLNSRLDELTAPINMTQAQLEQTPGWQFTNYQGQKAVQNAASARGLGVSGAALKGAANFATGLADQTYKTQFDIANTNQTNAYNRLKSLVDVGENASAQTGTFGANAANTSASAAMAAGNAQAAGYNAIGSAAGNTGNNIAGFALYKGLYGGNNPGNPSSGDRFTQGNNVG